MNSSAIKTVYTKKLLPRLKLEERDCPKCDSIIIKNEKEDCYECIKCGYIDCGNPSKYLTVVDKK